MKIFLLFWIAIIVTQKCEGHSILGDILTGAKEIGSQVHNAIQGTHGINTNFQAFAGGYGYNRPHQPFPSNNGGYNQPEPDTIIVVIEEEEEGNNQGQQPYRPPHGQGQPNQNHHHRPHPHRQPGNNYGPPHNNNGNYNGNANANNYGGHKPNNNKYPDQNNYGNNNQNYGNPPQNNYENSNSNNYANNQNEFTQKPFSIPTAKPVVKPDYGSVNEPTKENSEKPSDHSPNVNGNDHQEATKKPDSDDVPLFVPLKPDQYVYGGEKIEINAPKRETIENTNPAGGEELYPIDVRFGNKN